MLFIHVYNLVDADGINLVLLTGNLLSHTHHNQLINPRLLSKDY